MAHARTGTLSPRPLAWLLRELADGEVTGIIHVDGPVRHIVCLADGRVSLAMSSPGPSLQRVFVDAGAVDEAGWRTALDEGAGPGSVGRALLANGASREVVSDALRRLTLGTLLELLVPDHDDLRLAEGETHQFGAEITFVVDEMLDEADERLRRWGAPETALPSMGTVLRRTGSLPVGCPSIRLDRVQDVVVGGDVGAGE